MEITRDEVIRQVERYLNGETSATDFSEWTFNIISADEPKYEDDETMEAVYDLDNRDINELNESDLRNIIRKLRP